MSYVYEVSSSGSDGFVADPVWLKSVMQAGLVCGRCGWLNRSKTNVLAPIVVDHVYRNVHIGAASGLAGGHVLSAQLIELLGPGRIRSTAQKLAMSCSENGATCEGHWYVVEKTVPGCVRGSHRPSPTVCPDCGQLLYWPMDDRYILERYWPKGKSVALIRGRLYVERDFFETVLRPHRLTRLQSRKVRLAKEPEDGHPAEYEALIRSAKRRV